MDEGAIGGVAPKPQATPPFPLSDKLRGGFVVAGAGGMWPGGTGVSPVRLLERARQFRKNPTPSEDRLWQALRRGACGGLKFRRQQPMGRFIVDFFCASHKLAIEIDGPIHDTQREKDTERQTWLEASGLRFLRFGSRQVMEDLPGVLASILQVAEQIPFGEKS